MNSLFYPKISGIIASILFKEALNKIASIKRYLERIEEEYIGFENELETNFTKQDSIILNLQRACELSIDLANHVIKTKNLGIPQTTREVFILLENGKIIGSKTCVKMQKMVGFRNIAIHDYSKINLQILENILQNHLNDFSDFYKKILKL